MNAVALAASIGGSAVGLAGVIATGLNSWKERESRRQEATAAREHERGLARDARLWDDRKKAYVELLDHLLVLMEAVEDTFPQIRVRRVDDANEEEEQDEPAGVVGERDRLREMEAAVQAFGSAEVVALTRSFMDKARMFGFDVGTYKTVRDQAGAGQQVAHAYERLNATRQELRDLYQQLAEQIRTELTELG